MAGNNLISKEGLMQAWKTLSKRVGYDHPFMQIVLHEVELPNGKVFDDYAVWEAADVAQVVPVRSDGKVALVRLYKQGAQEIITEFPGGFVEKGEDPEAAARRELHEEACLDVTELIPLTTVIHHPTKESGRTHLFLAKVRPSQTKGKQDEMENITLTWVTFESLIDMIESGEVKQTGTIAAAFLAMRRMERDRTN